MLYDNFTVTIAQRQEGGYPISMEAEKLGRVSATLPAPDQPLKQSLTTLAAMRQAAPVEQAALRSAGQVLFRWLFAGESDTHLRIAWDRAERLGRGLRLRLSVDPPELSALPWELLYDPQRDHLFAASISTPLVRYLDQAALFGGMRDQRATLPLQLLLVIPNAPDLNVAEERAYIEEAVDGMQDLIGLRVLTAPVTQETLAAALIAGTYDILHFSGHGAFTDGEGYVAFDAPRKGRPEVVSGDSFSRLLGNHPALRLVVLNACETGRLDSHRAFVGLAPELVRRGIPAVVSMQFPVVDREATIFAREFYQQLCTGENAGQVDVAVTHARNVLSVLHPRSAGWAAPVIVTHAADGVIFGLAEVTERQTGADPARAASLIGSLQVSMEQDEDWALASPVQLRRWRKTLQRAEEAYRTHLEDANPDARQAAQYGLALITARLSALEQRLAAKPDP